MSPPRKKDKNEEDEETRPRPGIHSGVIRFEVVPWRIVTEYNPRPRSPTVEIGGAPWHAAVTETGVTRCLDIYLYGMANRSPLWSIDVDAQFVLVNSDSSKNIVRARAATLRCAVLAYGVTNLIAWKDLTNKKMGFINDGKITVIINFSIIKMTGFKTVPPSLDFTDPNDPRHDVALLIEGEKIYASKAILASYSPVFNAMFFGGFNEKDKKEIELQGIDREEFLEMLRVICPPHKKIKDDTVAYLLILADRFDINDLLDFAENHLIYLSEMEVARKLLIADQYKLIKLQGYCIREIANKNFEDREAFKSSDEYKQLSNALKRASYD